MNFSCFFLKDSDEDSNGSEASLHSFQSVLDEEPIAGVHPSTFGFNPFDISNYDWSILNQCRDVDNFAFKPDRVPGSLLKIAYLVEYVEDLRPLHVLKSYFPVLSSLRKQSNLYAVSKDNHYHISIPEIKGCLGKMIAMGIVKLPGGKDYWSTNFLLDCRWFRKFCSRVFSKFFAQYASGRYSTEYCAWFAWPR